MNDGLLNAEIREVREHRTWFLVMGILLIIIGTIAVGSAFGATMVSMIFLGWVLIISGLFELIHAIARRQWKGFFISLIGGVLYAVAGAIVLGNPGIAAITLTLLVAMILIAAGTFRVVVALTATMEHRGWLLFNGLISLLPGVLIWRSWPVSGLWVIGLFIGIDVIIDGWTEIMLAMVARPAPA
jgi:uncharacterized membrane protein HdeD (DUF308 family)